MHHRSLQLSTRTGHRIWAHSSQIFIVILLHIFIITYLLQTLDPSEGAAPWPSLFIPHIYRHLIVYIITYLLFKIYDQATVAEPRRPPAPPPQAQQEGQQRCPLPLRRLAGSAPPSHRGGPGPRRPPPAEAAGREGRAGPRGSLRGRQLLKLSIITFLLKLVRVLVGGDGAQLLKLLIITNNAGYS